MTSDLTHLEATVAASLQCPHATGCVWQTFTDSPQREKAVRADEACRWQRTVDRLITRVEHLERELRTAKKGTT